MMVIKFQIKKTLGYLTSARPTASLRFGEYSNCGRTIHHPDHYCMLESERIYDNDPR